MTKLNEMPILVTNLSADDAYNIHAGILPVTQGKCGLFFCQDGKAEVEINDTTYSITRGDVFFYLPSALLHVKHIDEQLRGVIISVDVDYVLPLSHRVLDVQDILQLRRYPRISLSEQQYRSVEELLNMFMRRVEVGKEADEKGSKADMLRREMIKAGGQVIFYQLMIIYYAHHPAHPMRITQKDNIFQHFITDLFHNYQSERDVSFYAQKQSLSPRYFSSVIKEKSGQTALAWIVQMVISEAKQLLESSDLSIKEIAGKLNFPTQSFFGKYFKQYVGVSPKEYRQKAPVSSPRKVN